MNTHQKKTDFEVSPPQIPPNKIKKIVNTDVVVIGAGISGLTAAASAAESGANTILLEKGDTCHYRGLHNAALSSCLQKRRGL